MFPPDASLTSPYPSRSVFLLAAHTPPDWQAAYPPYLATICKSQTLIERLIEQVHALGAEPYVVTNDPRIIERANLFVRPRIPNATLLQQIAATRKSWRNRVYFLRADAYYTDWSFESIFISTAEFLSFGTSPGSWGFSFRRDAYEDVGDALDEALDQKPDEDIPAFLKRLRRRGLEAKEIVFMDGSFRVRTLQGLLDCQDELENRRKKR